MLKVIEQGAYMNQINKIGGGRFTAKTTYLGTRYECDAVIFADARQMKMEKVMYAIHRTPGNEGLTEGEIPELVGAPCTFDGSKAIKPLRDYDGNGFIKELLLENLRGINQAEMYMLEEMGIPDPISYEEYWRDKKENYCRPYTGRMPDIYEWPMHSDYLKHYRNRNLYNKYKQYTILSDGGDEAVVSGTYQDSFHEMYAQLTYSQSGRRITDFDMTLRRWPFAACFEMDHMCAGLFIGRDIDELSKRETGLLIGGSTGCFHLVDIVADMAKAARDLRDAK